MKNIFKIVESEEGRVSYILKYTKSDGSDTVICVTKHHGDLYIKFNDIINIIDYKVNTVKIYRRMDMDGVKYFKQPSGDSGTYEIDHQFIRVDNIFKWLTGSTKSEARPLLRFIASEIVSDKEKFEDFTKPEPEESGWNFTPYKDKGDDDEEVDIDIESLTDTILSNSGVRKAIMNVLKNKLK